MSNNTTNRHLFHWLSTEKLDAFSQSGALKPYWRHFILSERRFVKGVSLCEEPMHWHPDDELPREPCLIIARQKIECPIHFIDSGSEYHLTRDIIRARRKGQGIDDVIEQHESRRKYSSFLPNEIFAEGTINLDWIVGVGFQEGCETLDCTAKEAALRFSDKNGLPLVDMSEWEVGMPHVTEIDDIIDEARKLEKSFYTI